ncbi:MAG TPA: Rieske 2Fe-2S domain-containing protein [Nocardioides sp.]|nr:Rieske 2Fe-2S domain-containing protein [Nocardioides sp.]
MCAADEVLAEEIRECLLSDGTKAIAVRDSDGNVKVFQGMCPHQRRALAEGDLYDDVLTCSAHMWSFDVRTGEGAHGTEAHIAQYPTKIEDGQVLVDPSLVEPVALWK